MQLPGRRASHAGQRSDFCPPSVPSPALHARLDRGAQLGRKRAVAVSPGSTTEIPDALFAFLAPLTCDRRVLRMKGCGRRGDTSSRRPVRIGWELTYSNWRVRGSGCKQFAAGSRLSCLPVAPGKGVPGRLGRQKLLRRFSIKTRAPRQFFVLAHTHTHTRTHTYTVDCLTVFPQKGNMRLNTGMMICTTQWPEGGFPGRASRRLKNALGA